MPGTEESSTITEPSYDLKKFQLTSILQNNSVRKSITLLGKFPDISEDRAIVLFEKQAFTENDVQTKESTDVKPSIFDDLQIQTEFINDIYGNFECIPQKKLNGMSINPVNNMLSLQQDDNVTLEAAICYLNKRALVFEGNIFSNKSVFDIFSRLVCDFLCVKTTVVYPATDKHIEKYSISQKYLIQETPELYENVTLPFITSSQFSLEWVYNILEHKQETERIVFEDADTENGFILVPDLKWDGRNVETLYLLAISHKRDIKSLRDLNASHLPLLRNIRKRTAETIEERYGLNSSQLRMYLHYQPSFYHFHVHINPLRNDAPGIFCEKSHMLDTIINNLELMSDYYERATIPFVVYDGSKLLDCYEEKIAIKKCLKRKNVNETDENSEGNATSEKRIKCDKQTAENVPAAVAEA